MNVTAPEPVSDMIMMKTLHDVRLLSKSLLICAMIIGVSLLTIESHIFIYRIFFVAFITQQDFQSCTPPCRAISVCSKLYFFFLEFAKQISCLLVVSTNRVAIGGLSEDALLAGCRVKPDRLISLGYEFLHPDIESALRWCIECYTSSC